MAGNDEYTKLLLHMDDTGLTDSSSSNHAITAHVNAARSDTYSQFGGYSVYLDGSSYLNSPYSTDWTFGSDDFTIDFWINKAGTWVGPSNPSIMFSLGSDFGTQTLQMSCYDNSGGTRFVVNITGGTTWDIILDNPDTWTNGDWHHVAFVRSGNTFMVFHDGVKQADTAVNSGAIVNNSAPMTVGARDDGAQNITAYMDEVRVSKGIARWTETFDPPEEPYSAYKFIGTTNDSARIITIDESSWDVIGSEVVSTGAYEISTTSGTKLIASRRETDGEIIAYGAVEPTT